MNKVQSSIILFLIFLTITGLSGCGNTESGKTLQIEKMRCEYLSSPVNIDNEHPRFGWMIISRERRQEQTAYRLVVSDDKSMRSIIWDSGHINSSNTNQSEYRGEKLQSNSEYFWKVFVWDKDSVMHESKVSNFGTALL